MIEFLKLLAEVGAKLVGPMIAAARRGDADSAAYYARLVAETAAARIAMRKIRERKP